MATVAQNGLGTFHSQQGRRVYCNTALHTLASKRPNSVTHINPPLDGFLLAALQSEPDLL